MKKLSNSVELRLTYAKLMKEWEIFMQKYFYIKPEKNNFKTQKVNSEFINLYKDADIIKHISSHVLKKL